MGGQERRTILLQRPKLRPLSRLDCKAQTIDHTGLARISRNLHGSANGHRSLLRYTIAHPILNQTGRGIARRSDGTVDTWSREMGL